MLSRQEFAVLYECLRGKTPSQRELVEATGYSLGAINTVVKALKEQGLLDEANALTEAGMKALEPHKVDNAIIMAAGMSTRFAPISYEKPKGVLTVKGEVLIERQIRQLKEAGIEDIIVVVGYKKECFFYLAEEFGVEIVVNAEYAMRNNNSTIMCVADRLGNSFLCSSDNYFVENPFEPYVYDAYYAAVFDEGETKEYCLHTRGKEDRIVGVSIGGHDEWVMLGHAYWDRTYSTEFVRILRDIYNKPTTADMLWEDIYIEYLPQLPMVMRKYDPGVIWEFDSLAELQEFDPAFVENVDSEIIDNICTHFDCERSGISNIVPIKQGLTNLSFRFDVAGQTYVYRHPGPDSGAFINRASETASEKVAHELGLDDSFVFEDPQAGWKISRFIENANKLDYADEKHVADAIATLQTLHTCTADTGFNFDHFAAAEETIAKLGAQERTMFKDFESLRSDIAQLDKLAKEHGARTCLCHNDFVASNILVAGGELHVIDWEYSAMSDYASDLAVFITCAPNFSYEDALQVLHLYFGREPSEEELFHCIASIAVVSFFWFVWALYKDEHEEAMGESLYQWYKNAKEYGRRAHEMAQDFAY